MKKQDFKSKHDHKLTDWLKVIIFSILMMAPFFSITTRCLYVINNKNAKDSYSGKEQYTETAITNINQINIYDYLHFDSNVNYSQTSNQVSGYIEYDNVNNVNTSNNNLITNLSDGKYFQYFVRNDSKQFYIYDENLNVIYNNNLIYNTLTFEFRILSFTSTITQTLQSFSILTFNNYSYIDNAFDYSISQLAESPTFNWTTQTATYEVFDNMLTGLTIQGGILPILLTYWMMLIVVYIIVDIIIKTFTFITHLIAQ